MYSASTSGLARRHFGYASFNDAYDERRIVASRPVKSPLPRRFSDYDTSDDDMSDDGELSDDRDIIYGVDKLKVKSECPVCLSDNLDAIVKLPECNHEFCLPCISAWLKESCTCPLCRLTIRASTLRKLNDKVNEST